MSKNPLGKPTDYADGYSPGVLYAVPRIEARAALGLGAKLPFRGEDIWNAWELTWLDLSGKPIAATASFTVRADSANLIESKSLKLYLNSLAMSRYASQDEVAEIIRHDLTRIAGSDVAVRVRTASDSASARIDDLPGRCIDDVEVQIDVFDVDATILENAGAELVDEALHSHLLRSNCPVTRQPDIGSVLIRYRGPRIDHESLLRYIVSFRQHSDFHEACVERMYLDIKNRCCPVNLTVYARYNRRGGLDINPFRSDFESSAEDLRLWRQ